MSDVIMALLLCVASSNAANFHTDEPTSVIETEETITRTETPVSDGGAEDQMYDKEGLGAYAAKGSFPKSAQIDWSQYQNKPAATVSGSQMLVAPQPMYGLSQALEGDKKPRGLLQLFGIRYRTNQPRKEATVPQKNGLSQLHKPIVE